jgi:murein DD-endopeptidase MepM/ murein hydrolase activator NlpD
MMIKISCGVVFFLLSWAGMNAQHPGEKRCPLADGFDFPVGKPNADQYYKQRGFIAGRHPGEDWNGAGGGNSDFGAPIYAIGNGVVVLSQQVGRSWGRSVIIRHAYRDQDGIVKMIDSMSTHLASLRVTEGQIVKRGDLIGTMGGNDGMYPVHLHFEIRKNLSIGMNRLYYPRDLNHYYSPTTFIEQHRRLEAGFFKHLIPLGLFLPFRANAEEFDPVDFTKHESDGNNKVSDDESFWNQLRAKIKQQQNDAK